MKALYRKYRPISLDTVVGQGQVVDPLKNSLKRGKISHAYLFCGPRGTGKTSIARIFAHEINGFKYELEDNYIDIMEIDAASNTGVDNIRDLREKAVIAPSEGKYKIYIIDEVHMLSKSAFNALLKIMEEPPEHVVFIMATTNPEKVPITITSRAQIYTFKLADADVMFDHLKSIAEKEKIKIADDALKIVVARGGGSFRDSISLLDQISILNPDGEITTEAVDAALGLPSDVKISELLNLYSAGDATGSVRILRELLDSGIEAEALASSLIEAIVANPNSTTLNLAERLFNVQDPFAEAKLLVAFLSANIPAASTSPTVSANAAPTAQAVAIPRATAPAHNATTLADSSAPVHKSPTTSSAPAAETSTPSASTGPAITASETPSAPALSASAASSSDRITPTSVAAPPPATAQNPTAAASSSIISATSADDFIATLAPLSSAVASIVEKCQLVLSDNTIDIYPKTKGYQKILQSENNMKLLRQAAGASTISIHEAGEAPAKKAPKPAPAPEVSAIMGDVQEVLEDGDDPF